MVIVNPTAALTKAIVAGSGRRRALHGVAMRRRRRAMGDTTTSTPVPVAMLSQDQYNQQMLAVANNQYAYLQQIWHEATVQRYIATAATVAIPVFATIWKWILKRRAG